MSTRLAPIEVFYSYADADESLRIELDKHLSQLRREGLITTWHKRQIVAGMDWAKTLDRHLNTASVVLLLISSDFVASDYCYGVEMQQAMQRNAAGEAHIIPILLRPVDWQSAPFGKLQALPSNGTPITKWSNPDAAFADVAQGIRAMLQEVQHLALNTPITLFPLSRQLRKRVCQRLHRYYQDYLEDSLQHAAWLDLELSDKPDALYHPLTLTTQGPTLSEQPLPAGTSIVSIYEEAHQELLILGEPGAGKSTLLYVLAQHLLHKAEEDPCAQLPFILPLSSWAKQQAPLEQWMVEQLTSLYKLDERLAQQLVQTDQILPFLDGLDEMEDGIRSQCIIAINHYHQKHLQPLVVCSRSAQYMTSSRRERLVLQRAVVIQPLTERQITEVLAGGGERLASLRTTYKTNVALRELAASPLFLNLLILTYQGTSIRALPSKKKKLQKQVFEHYVQRMITHKGNVIRYPSSRTIPWLAFLALRMREQNQIIFTLDMIQPGWLPKKRQTAYFLSVLLPASIFMVVGQETPLWVTGPLSSIITWLILTLTCILYVELTTGLYAANFNVKKMSHRATQPSSRLRWSWKNVRAGLIEGLITWLVAGVIIGSHSGWVAGLLLGLLIGLLLWLLQWLISGLAPTRESEHVPHLLSPKAELNRSLKQGIFLGLFGGLLLGIIGGFILGLLSGIFLGIIGGLAFGLYGGLHAYYVHYMLRFWYWTAGVFPFRVITFLEDSCARHLTKRVGGTYQFTHRLLLDYFADLFPKQP